MARCTHADWAGWVVKWKDGWRPSTFVFLTLFSEQALKWSFVVSSPETGRCCEHRPDTSTSAFINFGVGTPCRRQLHHVRFIQWNCYLSWKLMRMIWVRSVAVELGNKWFVIGAGDWLIEVWGLASSELKLSLAGHISIIWGLAVPTWRPYLFYGEGKVRV